ncbi:MAG TPA: Hsp20/alpha crystallin family protein [Anaerolineales bacterium]|nr:Hsp20/alpha crystallin family protein [Anaerolineales bacterium]
MYRRFTSPAWREMEDLQRQMNRLFEDFFPTRFRTAPEYPAVNIWADEESVLVTAELPGVKADDLDINVLGDNLTVAGLRPQDEAPEDARYHRRERGFGKFSRTIQLPFQVDIKNVKATFKNGVLNITLPRAEVDKPKKIAIKSA